LNLSAVVAGPDPIAAGIGPQAWLAERIVIPAKAGMTIALS